MARSLALLVAAGLLMVPGQAVADADADARQAFDDGAAAEKRGAWTDAADAYQRAYTLKPHPYALFNLGRAREHTGELRLAAEAYQRYLDESPAAADRPRVQATIASLRATEGALTVETTLAGTPVAAEVMVDGAARGTAPQTLRLPGGPHRVELQLGSRRASRDVVTEFGEPQRLVIDVSARPGALAVRANVDGAAVTIDGFLAGATPLHVDLPAGPHVVDVSASGHVSSRQTVDLAPGGSAALAFYVAPLPTAPAPPAPPERDRAGVLAVQGLITVDGRDGLVTLIGTRAGPLTAGVVLGAWDGAGYYGTHADVMLSRRRLTPLLGIGVGYVVSEQGGVAVVPTAGLAVRDVLPGLGVRVDLHVTASAFVQWTDRAHVAFPLGASLVFSRR